ncbi:hypothetical protein HOY82DRAFT_651239 [Tuber indicum]|nr:hypothetical protein HOY82DRAFT_651239 [Tuber indicum]
MHSKEVCWDAHHKFVAYLENDFGKYIVGTVLYWGICIITYRTTGLWLYAPCTRMVGHGTWALSTIATINFGPHPSFLPSFTSLQPSQPVSSRLVSLDPVNRSINRPINADYAPEDTSIVASSCGGGRRQPVASITSITSSPTHHHHETDRPTDRLEYGNMGTFPPKLDQICTFVDVLRVRPKHGYE